MSEDYVVTLRWYVRTLQTLGYMLDWLPDLRVRTQEFPATRFDQPITRRKMTRRDAMNIAWEKRLEDTARKN